MPFHEEYLNSIKAYPKQFSTAWKDTRKINLPEELSPVREIVVAGMGGSNFGARIIKSAFESDSIICPIEIVNGYDLPSYCDEDTLVLLTSYSGTTEEVISVLKQAKSRGCKMLINTSGGKLKTAIESHNVSGYVFDTKFNPSKAPRTSLGYILGSTLGLLSSLGLVRYDEKDFDFTMEYIQSFINVLDKNDKMSIQLAQSMLDKIPVFITSQHLNADSWIWRNFMNETAKHRSFQMEIPELNHHFLDGLLFPKGVRDEMLFVYVKSKLYNTQNTKRMEITRQVTKEQNYPDISISLGAKTKFNEIWELIIIGCFVSYHLAKMHGVNPSSNDYVDRLKSELAK